MSVFKDHKVGVNDLLQVIPESLMANLSLTTQVDHYAKVLHGQKLFYLLMYGVLENERLSQRSLEDTFNDPFFKQLFNLNQNESVRRSSISERLSKIDPEYFKKIYDCIYEQFSGYYSSTEREKYNLIRVDSTMVSDTTGKLKQGLVNGKKKLTKFGISFDGILPASLEVYTESTYASEDVALPQVIMNHVKKETGHNNIYIIDRGLQSARIMKDFSSNKISFVARIKESRKHIEKENLIVENQQLDFGETVLVKDVKIQVYKGVPTPNKTGGKYHKEELVDTEFRLVIVKSKVDGKEYWLLTNEFDLSAQQVAQAYRKRWDIEVFFRFIKQELNVSHLVSLNKNGMQVMIYVTLIVAMLILVYKKANNIGYKTAKRRFTMEIRNLTIALIVIECGGDPKLFFKT
jgi:Transposase DDE domain